MYSQPDEDNIDEIIDDLRDIDPEDLDDLMDEIEDYVKED